MKGKQTMQLSGCIEMLFKSEFEDFPARIRACRDAGLDGVEFWRWRGKDLDGIATALSETGLPVTAFSVEPSGHIVDPGTHAEFLRGVRGSITVAQRLGARTLIVLGGNALDGVPRAAQRAAIVAALRAAAPLAEAAGITLVLEPLNTVLDHVGQFLDRTPDGLDIVAEVGSSAVRLLYDAYHSAMMDEDPATVLAGRGALISHVHAADRPGRHEPGSGTIDWRALVATLRAVGYAGPVGLEYRPTGRTETSLRAARPLLAG
jgi:hydroxypyruvate isomerase